MHDDCLLVSKGHSGVSNFLFVNRDYFKFIDVLCFVFVFSQSNTYNNIVTF